MIRRLVSQYSALRPAERRLALIAVMVIGCWAFVSLVVQPLLVRRDVVRQQVETQSEKLEAIHRVLSQADAVDQVYQQYAPYLDTADGGTFFSELESVARTASVTMNLKPRPVKTDGRVSRLEVELDVEGPQANLLAFLDSVLQMPKLVAIDRLRLSTTPAKEGVLRANLILRKLSIR